jgi:hypothetical protein
VTRAALFFVMLLAGVAHADAPKGPTGKQRIVGILEVRGPTPHDEAAFEKNLEQQLDTNQYWLAPRAKMRERLRNSTKWTEGCVVHHCLSEVKVQTNAELVILAALTGSGTSFGFVVTLVRTDTGRVVSQESERCDVCTLNETMNAATLATIKLLNALPDRLPDETAQQGAAVDLAIGTAMAPVQSKLVAERRTTTRAGITLTVVGLVAAAAGTAAYLLQDDRPDYGLVAAAAGGGLAAGGIIVLAF